MSCSAAGNRQRTWAETPFATPGLLLLSASLQNDHSCCLKSASVDSCNLWFRLNVTDKLCLSPWWGNLLYVHFT